MFFELFLPAIKLKQKMDQLLKPHLDKMTDNVKKAEAKKAFEEYLKLTGQKKLSAKDEKRLNKLENRYPVFKDAAIDIIKEQAKSDPKFFDKMAQHSASNPFAVKLLNFARANMAPFSFGDGGTGTGDTGTGGTGTGGTGYNKFTPEQQTGINKLLESAQGRLGEENKYGFENIANEARRQFGQEVVPSIASRFSASGGIRSGAFPRMLAGEKSNLESRLAALGAQYEQNQQGITNQRFGAALQPSYSGPLIQQGAGAGSSGQQFGQELINFLSNKDVQSSLSGLFSKK